VSEASQLTLVAGPNGAGKSTFTAMNNLRGSLIDPDAIARRLNPSRPEMAAVAASREALRLAEQYIREQRDFVQETTLSGQFANSLIDRALAAGFEIDVRYIGVESSLDSKQRVAMRVLLRGHDVPATDIERRFQRSLEILPTILAKANRATVYDNSRRAPYRELAKLQLGRMIWCAPRIPLWFEGVVARLNALGETP
jgi:predicted ABC-type ATPase